MIIIIGAGASGLMAAYLLAKQGHEVSIFEKNSQVGKKINITGKGRCNLTNDCSPKDFIKNVVRNPKFLFSSIFTFTPQDTIKLFNDLGLETELTRGQRIFPKSMNALDVSKTLHKAVLEAGVKVYLNESVTSVLKNDELFTVLTNKGQYEANKVIVATGGLSYPLTGSTGDGYKIASSFSHTITPLVPGLNALKIEEEIDPNLFKFTLKNVQLTAKTNNKSYSEFGELTFYKEGIAGPIALTISSLINRIDYKEVTLSLDFKPALSYEQLDQRIIREIQNNSKGTIKELLKTLLPMEIIHWFCSLKEINWSYPLAELTKDNRRELLSYLKEFKFNYLGLDDIERATVTSGGINVDEVDSKTLESKLIKNLYFIGEVLDVDAYTGGFNLQIAFSTAATLAKNIK